LACESNSFSFTSVISPSNTEFCIQLRYLRHSLSILPTRFSLMSYTKITYISPSRFKGSVIFHSQDVLSQFITFQFDEMLIAYIAFQYRMFEGFIYTLFPSTDKLFPS